MMAKRFREAHLAHWSVRLLRALNLLIVLGSIAFLTFEIQFEPHPAEFGWSLIMIAMFTFLSGLIGGVSAGQAGCFFPHMFFIFVSLMGLFSLSVLLFVRPDEVARKMLAFHITLSNALHHLLIDAYFFSLLGFLQFLVFSVASFFHKRSYGDYYEEFDIPFHQPQLTPETSDSEIAKHSMRTSTAIMIRDSRQESSSHWKSDQHKQFEHSISKATGAGGAQDCESPSLKMVVQPLHPISAAAAAAATEVLRGDDKAPSQQVQMGRSKPKLLSSRSLRGAEMVDLELGRGFPDNHARSLSNGKNPRLFSHYSSSARLENAKRREEDDDSSSSSCTSSSSSSSASAWTDPDSIGSPCRWHYSVSKDDPAAYEQHISSSSSSSAFDINLNAALSAKRAVEAGICVDIGNRHSTNKPPAAAAPAALSSK